MSTRQQGNTFVDIKFRSGLTPGANYTSGLTVYDESLMDGRLIGRYWSAVGFKKPEKDISKDIEATYGYQLQAFDLEMDGQALHFGWNWIKAYEENSNNSDIHHAVIELSHQIRPVNIKVHTQLDGTPFITRWLEITNTSDKTSALSSISPWSGLIWHIPNHRHPFCIPGTRESGSNDSAFSVGSFIKRIWGAEGDFDWQSLPNGTLRLEGIEGRSGHGCPFFIVRNEGTGEFFIGHLAWSGNWRIEFNCNRDRGKGDELLFFKIGPFSPGPMRVVAPGETIKSPEVHLGLLQGDLDNCVQLLHNHIRRSVLPPQPEGRAQRVIYNHWGYMDQEVSEDFLKQEIDIAAEIGCELFEVDAGWFGDKNTDWWNTVGDWYCGDRLPNGLEPVFQYARKKGLLYGLWVEPERIGLASKIYKEHPDWVIRRYGVPFAASGELDLTKPEVASWVESEIVRLIRRYDLDLFRLDYNVAIYEGGQCIRDGFLENTIWRHYEVIYGIFDRLQKEFPKLLIENCSSGGGRKDLGMVGRSHTGWLSDWMVQPRSLKILNGMTIALPPEYCNRMTGVLMSAYLKSDLDFQLRVPLFGHWSISGVSPSIKEINPVVKERITHHIKLYKDFIRPMLPTCRVFHHTPVLNGLEPEGWCVLEYASSDASRTIAGIFRLAGKGEEEYIFHPRGLDVSRQYKVTFDNKGKSIKREGVELEQKGLVIRLGKLLTSELVLFESI